MSLRNQPYFPFYVDDFLTDEKLNECSARAHGVYIKIMCLMHKSEEYGKILLKQKDNQTKNQISNFAYKLVKHLPFPRSEIEAGLIELIEEKVLYIEGNYLCQKRMIKDNKISEIRTNAGKKGGNPELKKRKKEENLVKDLVNQNPNQNTGNGNEDEDEDVNEDEVELMELIEPGEKIEFDVFWDAYEKKVGKKVKLIKKWNELSANTQMKILKHIELYKQAQPDKQYRKNPETYLNNESWNDEIIFGGNNGNGRTKINKENNGYKSQLAEPGGEEFDYITSGSEKAES